MTPEEKAVLEAALKVADQCYDEPSRCMQHSAVVACADAVAAYRQSLKPKPRYRWEQRSTMGGIHYSVLARLDSGIEQEVAICHDSIVVPLICRLLNEEEGRGL